MSEPALCVPGPVSMGRGGRLGVSGWVRARARKARYTVVCGDSKCDEQGHGWECWRSEAPWVGGGPLGVGQVGFRHV